jgi:hypothetical protein
MRLTPSFSPNPSFALYEIAVLAGAMVIALLSARDYASSANDGSRLATVECLVDYHTLAIDRSIFVQPLSQTDPTTPYPPNQPSLREFGTRDKIYVKGHYYSHKSPVPALLMAGLYQSWQSVTGLAARQRPDLFCLVMTLGSSGLAYCVAVWGVFRLSRTLALPPHECLALTACFALTTLALPYAQHVNDHILLLAVAALMMLNLEGMAREVRTGIQPTRCLLSLGTLVGLGYTIDLGTGPVLLLCTVGVVLFRCRRLAAMIGFTFAASPWLVLHHAVNYSIGGTLKPASAVPEFFQWPGSPFNTDNMTGVWHHQNLGGFLTYAANLLVGSHGFFAHNLVLFLTVPGAVYLLCRRKPERPEVSFAVCFSVGTWLLYALGSNNYAGYCCSIRWFVPLLAAGFYVLAVYLRTCPYAWKDFAILVTWGAIAGALMAWQGPWLEHKVPWFWVLHLAALSCWGLYRVKSRWRPTAVSSSTGEPKRWADAA